MFTIGNYIFLGLLIATLLAISIMIGICTDFVALGVSSSIISIAIFIGAIFGINWYNTSTAFGIRAYKDYQSNIDNGIE